MKWISHYGVLLELHTDQRRNFKSYLSIEICKQLKINKIRTTLFHPQSDGIVERFNRTLLQHHTKVYTKVMDEHQQDWDHYIQLFMLSYRSSIHESTHHMLIKVISGHKLGLPCDLEFKTPPEKLMPVNEFVVEIKNYLRRIYSHNSEELIVSDYMMTRI